MPLDPGNAASPAAVAIYYVTLPDPLGMPNGLLFRFQYDERELPYISAVGRAPQTAIEMLAGGGPFDVSLRLWQVPSQALAEIAAMSAAVEVAEVGTGVHEHVRSVDFTDLVAQSGDAPTSVFTVAEVATYSDRLLDADDGEPVDLALDDLTDPLLRSLHCLQHFVRAYRIGTHTRIPEPTYQRLPQRVLMATRPVGSDALPKIHSVVTLSHENVRDKPPTVAETSQLSQWLASVQLLSAGDPAALVQERLLEAERMALVEGNYGACVIEGALAAETLLDGLLALVLWEKEGGAPNGDGLTETAAAALSKPLRSRVRSVYHPLLGGRWDPNTDGVIKDWDLKVARLRGRIVHRGYRPTPDEATDALTTVHALHDYVCDRLAAKCQQYPRTALMFLGEQGLRDRNAWPRIRAFAEDAAMREPPWRDNYSAWRDRVDAEVVRRS